MKLRNFFDNLYEALISGDQFTRTKESVLAEIKNVIGKYLGRKIEIDIEISKNTNLMNTRMDSIFKSLEMQTKNFSPEEKANIYDEIWTYIVKVGNHDKDIESQVYLAIEKLKRYK